MLTVISTSTLPPPRETGTGRAAAVRYGTYTAGLHSLHSQPHTWPLLPPLSHAVKIVGCGETGTSGDQGLLRSALPDRRMELLNRDVRRYSKQQTSRARQMHTDRKPVVGSPVCTPDDPTRRRRPPDESPRGGQWIAGEVHSRASGQSLPSV